jgi:putative ABC transport system permease protein
MLVMREWVRRIWGTLRQRRADRDMEEELRLHAQLAAEDAQRLGCTPEAAARTSAVRVGRVPQALDAMRDQRGLPWLEDLLRDVRHGVKALAREPAVACLAVLTLALGIGANTAIFSIVNAVLLQPLPFEQPERLVSKNVAMPAGEFLVIRDHARTLASAALYNDGAGFNLSASGHADRLAGAYVSDTFFETLGAQALLGRTLRSGENEPGSSHVVVLSQGLRSQRFGADPGIVGHEILVDSQPKTGAGVQPEDFSGPSSDTRLWVAYTFNPRSSVDLWGSRAPSGRLVARMTPGTTLDSVRADVLSLVPQMRSSNTIWTLPPAHGENWRFLSLQEQLVGDVRGRLLVIFGAVGCVLLIACVNVAGLLLAHARGRQREFAVRHALGASRGRLVRQFLTESAVLGLLGGAVGLLLAFLGIPLLLAGLPGDIPRADEIGADARVLGFALALSVLTGLAFGAFPAWRSARKDPQAHMKEESREARAPLGRAAGLLVAAEMAVAVLLVVGAGLFIRSFAQLLRVDAGFRAEGLVTARITPPESRFGNESEAALSDQFNPRRRAFYEAVLERVTALPGVEAVEAVSLPPLVPFTGGVSQFIFETEDDRFVPGQYSPAFWDRRVTPGYLQTMGIDIVHGRGLQDSDLQSGAAVINETMAREHWPGEDPVGKRFKVTWLDTWMTVVGVVRDVKYDGLSGDVRPEVYRPFSESPAREMSLVIRTAGMPPAFAERLREAVAAVDPTVPVSDVRTIEQLVTGSVAGPRFTTRLLSVFAAVALALAAIGIYGMLTYVVSRRTREIAVRMALGAPRRDVLLLVLRRALLPACGGLLAGLVAALAATRTLQSLLFEVSATDPVTFAVVPVLLLAVALLAAWMPASRATRVDPLVALRME